MSANLTSQNLGKSDGCFSAVVADFNGDGLADILEYENQLNNSAALCYSSGSPQNTLFLNMGGGAFTSINIPSTVSLNRLQSIMSTVPCTVGGKQLPATSYTAGSTFYLLDINGDGLIDIVSTTLSGGEVGPTSCQFPISGTTQVYFGASTGKGNYSFNPVTTNLSNLSVYTKPPTAIFPAINTIDINGDGYSDLLVTMSVPGTAGGVWLSNGDGTFTQNSTTLSCDQAIDVNGDGKPDCIQNATPSFYITNGTPSPSVDAMFNLAVSGLFPALTATTVSIGNVSADINGDGRGDLIVWNDTPTSNALWLSNGDGSFALGTTNLTSWQLRKSDGSYDFSLGDFTGHGTPELMIVNASGSTWGSKLLVRVNASGTSTPDWRPPDQLVSVTSPTGLVTKLSWVPLATSTDSIGVAHYTPDAGTSNAATYPTVDLSPAVWMVASSTSDTGVGVTGAALVDTTNYFFAGLKADTRGRGALGFRQVARTNPGADGTNLTVTTNYVQSYPYIGVVANTATTVASTGAMLSQTWNQYCDMTSTGAVPTISAGEVQGAALPACSSSAALVNQPYILATYESGKDVNGTVLPDVLTTNLFGLENGHPNMGDPTSISTVTGANTSGSGGALNQSFTKTVTNTYLTADSSGSNWALGRLINSTVKNVISAASTLTSSAGNSTGAAATSGTLTPISVNWSSTAVSANAVAGTATTTARLSSYATLPFSFAFTDTLSGTSTNSITATGNPATGLVTFTATGMSSASSLAIALFNVTITDAAGRSGTTTTPITVSFSGQTAGTFALQAVGVLSGAAGSPSLSSSGTALSGNIIYGNATVAAVYLLTFVNTGPSASTMGGFTLANLPELSLAYNGCAGSVAPGATCQVALSNNTSYGFGPFSGTWAATGVTTGGVAGVNATGTLTDNINGTGARWGSSTSAQTLNFGSVVPTLSTSQSISMTNVGNQTASWTALANLPSGFTASLSGCSSLAPGASCTVTVTFTPTQAQSYGGINNIYPTPAPNGNVNYLTVIGSGVRLAAPLSITSATANYALAPSKVGGYVAGFTDVELTVSSTVYSTSSTSPALSISGFAAGDTVTLAGSGTIYGAGGAGGAGLTPTAGSAGGDAISTSFPFSFNSYTGTVAGGGGGGGGGGIGWYTSTSVVNGKVQYTFYCYGGGGGGGGAGYNGGSAGAGGTLGGTCTYNYPGHAGASAAAPSSTGAGGGAGPGGQAGGNGGAVGAAGGTGAAGSAQAGGGGGGGGLGAAGGSGGVGLTNSGAAGGAAGYAVRKNGQTVAGTLPTHYGLIQ
jgi:hypothetical protein